MQFEKEIDKELKRICDESIERNFETIWALHLATMRSVYHDCDWCSNDENKGLARAWFMLGRNAAESGVGAAINKPLM